MVPGFDFPDHFAEALVIPFLEMLLPFLFGTHLGTPPTQIALHAAGIGGEGDLGEAAAHLARRRQQANLRFLHPLLPGVAAAGGLPLPDILEADARRSTYERDDAGVPA